jgi:hypothetical protein
MDVRATRVNGAPLTAQQTTKFIPDAHADDVIQFDVFAIVVGQNASTADDKFISVSGSWLSRHVPSTFDMLGTLALDVVHTTYDSSNGQILTPGFDGPGYSVGQQQDLDLDGDLDVGGQNDANDAGFWEASYILGGDGIGAGSTSPISGGRKIGFGTFTVSSPGITQVTEIFFDGRNSSMAAVYVQDGVLVQEASVNAAVPLRIGTPEPSCMSLVALAGALLRRHGRAVPTRYR